MRPLHPDYACGPSAMTVLESQWENLVLITMDLDIPRQKLQFSSPFFGPPGSEHLSGSKATAVIT